MKMMMMMTIIIIIMKLVVTMNFATHSYLLPAYLNNFSSNFFRR